MLLWLFFFHKRDLEKSKRILNWCRPESMYERRCRWARNQFSWLWTLVNKMYWSKLSVEVICIIERSYEINFNLIAHRSYFRLWSRLSLSTVYVFSGFCSFIYSTNIIFVPLWNGIKIKFSANHRITIVKKMKRAKLQSNDICFLVGDQFP